LHGLLPSGVGFHNASLTNPERRVVEQAFRERTVKVLVATPTLAAGINLPARRVIVRDTSRYEGRLGMQMPIPAGEIHQMLGRAGRPRFDTSGEALLLARSVEDEERLLEDYLSAPPEDVVSRLAAEPDLGRAGRPRFDTSGEALLLARSVEDEERLLEDYLSAPPEDVVSRLAAEP